MPATTAAAAAEPSPDAADATTGKNDSSQFDVFVAVADPEARPTSAEGPAAVAQSEMRRVDEVLIGLRTALVDVVQRPAQTVDIQPLLAAMNKNLAATAAQQDQAASALHAVATGLQDFGQQVARSGSATLDALTTLQHNTPRPPIGDGLQAAPAFVVAQSVRSPMRLIVIAFLLLCWAVVFWFKIGSPRLALGAMVVANVVGCGVLIARRI